MEPDFADLPVQIPIGHEKLSLLTGSTLMTALVFLLVPLLVLIIIAVAGRKSRNDRQQACLCRFQSHVVGNALFIFLGYFGPNIIQAAIVVVRLSTESTLIFAVIGGAFSVVLITALLCMALGNQFLPQVSVDKSPSGEISFRNRTKNSMFVETFGATFDAARSENPLIRVYFLEEFLISVLLQVVAAVRPEGRHCGPVSLMMAVISCAHFLYLLLARPYAARLELLLAIIAGVLQLVISIMSAVLAFREDQSSTPLDEPLQTMMWMLGGFFFFQMIAIGFDVVVTRHKKKTCEVLGGG
jgi:hypothetical protein